MEYGRERVIKASVMPPVFFLNDWKKGGSILLAVKWKSVCVGVHVRPGTCMMHLRFLLNVQLPSS